jgi:hypothetical protein
MPAGTDSVAAPSGFAVIGSAVLALNRARTFPVAKAFAACHAYAARRRKRRRQGNNLHPKSSKIGGRSRRGASARCLQKGSRRRSARLARVDGRAKTSTLSLRVSVGGRRWTRCDCAQRRGHLLRCIAAVGFRSFPPRTFLRFPDSASCANADLPSAEAGLWDDRSLH